MYECRRFMDVQPCTLGASVECRASTAPSPTYEGTIAFFRLHPVIMTVFVVLYVGGRPGKHAAPVAAQRALLGRPFLQAQQETWHRYGIPEPHGKRALRPRRCRKSERINQNRWRVNGVCIGVEILSESRHRIPFGNALYAVPACPCKATEPQPTSPGRPPTAVPAKKTDRGAISRAGIEARRDRLQPIRSPPEPSPPRQREYSQRIPAQEPPQLRAVEAVPQVHEPCPGIPPRAREPDPAGTGGIASRPHQELTIDRIEHSGTQEQNSTRPVFQTRDCHRKVCRASCSNRLHEPRAQNTGSSRKGL